MEWRCSCLNCPGLDYGCVLPPDTRHRRPRSLLCRAWGFSRARWWLGYCAILGNLEVRKVTDRTRTATPDTYRSASVNFSSGWDTGAEDVALERGAIGFPSLKRNILESN